MMDFHQRRPVPAASRGTARRRRVQGGRPIAVKIRLTDTEYAAVTARACGARVSIQRFLTDCALTRPHPVAVPSALTAELAALRRLSANLANNINQIARKLNSGGSPDASIGPALDAVRRTMDRLDQALSAVTARNPPTSGTGRITAPPSRNETGNADATGRSP
jgi:Bacterial mobilisation protein (MobC)